MNQAQNLKSTWLAIIGLSGMVIASAGLITVFVLRRRTVEVSSGWLWILGYLFVASLVLLLSQTVEVVVHMSSGGDSSDSDVVR